MDKQKIEEMANDMGVSCGECYTCKYEGEVKCIDFLCAEELYKAGYRKIPEGAVVLTREAYERLCDLAYFGNGEETVRKETAEKLLDEIDYESNGQTKSITDLLRKKYGV